MSWTYWQSTGVLRSFDGALEFAGFAGHDAGFDNPELQAKVNLGPLPRGQYSLAAWFDHHPVVGLCAIELTPLPGTDMLGRSGFFIHGPELAHPLESSHGCIVVGNCNTRQSIWAQGDRLLTVVE